MDASKKIAIVTGGTKGIGRQIVIELLRRGYFVYTNYAHDEQQALQAGEIFSDICTNFKIMRADQSEQQDFDKFIADVRKNENSVSCIICNTGITLRKSIINISNSDWERTMQVNVNSHFFLIRDLFQLIEPDSRIIFISSVLANYPHATSLAYGVTKSAIVGLTKNLVKFFEGTGTTVNTILAGFTATEWQSDKPQAMKESICEKIAHHRFAQPEEIAQACMFCLDNAFVNGEGIEVSGGYCFK